MAAYTKVQARGSRGSGRADRHREGTVRTDLRSIAPATSTTCSGKVTWARRDGPCSDRAPTPAGPGRDGIQTALDVCARGSPRTSDPAQPAATRPPRPRALSAPHPDPGSGSQQASGRIVPTHATRVSRKDSPRGRFGPPAGSPDHLRQGVGTGDDRWPARRLPHPRPLARPRGASQRDESGSPFHAAPENHERSVPAPAESWPGFTQPARRRVAGGDLVARKTPGRSNSRGSDVSSRPSTAPGDGTVKLRK